MDWYEDYFNYNLNLINDDFKNYKISDALIKVYRYMGRFLLKSNRNH